ncbi:MAG TPA: ABC transporter permease [Candidatus Thermoplasmatota archaeon]|nr:ABC transporter permease [Candidatus Thermoplasmatota archaeon]
MTTAAFRTFNGAFRLGFKNTLRGYTGTGWLVSTLLTPLFLVASAWVISRLVAPDGSPDRFTALTGITDYLTFVVIGFAFNGFLLSALDDGGSAVYDEQQAGTFELLAMSPMNPFAWMFGKTLASQVAAIIDLAIVIAVGGLLFGLQLTPTGLAWALLGLVLTLAALQGVAFVFAALGLGLKEPHALTVLMSPVFIFLSGMMFPVQALPGWVQVFSYSFPLTHGLDLVRGALLTGAGAEALLPSVWGLLVTGAVWITVGWVSFRALEKRARAKGTLGTY